MPSSLFETVIVRTLARFPGTGCVHLVHFAAVREGAGLIVIETGHAGDF